MRRPSIRNGCLLWPVIARQDSIAHESCGSCRGASLQRDNPCAEGRHGCDDISISTGSEQAHVGHTHAPLSEPSFSSASLTVDTSRSSAYDIPESLWVPSPGRRVAARLDAGSPWIKSMEHAHARAARLRELASGS